MDDKDFSREADAVLAHLDRALEQCGADLDFELQPGGILEIEFADGSKIIINRHGVAKEIWVAARAGGFHFRWNNGRWEDTRDGRELLQKLSDLASQQAGDPVNLC